MRRNDGYALPFVLVVSVVMCLIAVTVMTFSLDNLQAQQASIGRMQAKYEAAGKVEEILTVMQKTGADKIFEESEHLAFCLETEAENSILKIASSDQTRNVWILVEVMLEDDHDGELTKKISLSEHAALTIKNAVQYTVVKYEVAALADAEEFIPHLKDYEGENAA